MIEVFSCILGLLVAVFFLGIALPLLLIMSIFTWKEFIKQLKGIK